MPFDLLPENLDFDVQFEDTKVHDKRNYVVNGTTGEYIGIVGDKFNCVNHEKFFSGVYNINARQPWRRRTSDSQD